MIGRCATDGQRAQGGGGYNRFGPVHGVLMMFPVLVYSAAV
jgi:hypothetical protein